MNRVASPRLLQNSFTVEANDARFGKMLAKRKRK
jgi:hypothetical protein